MVKNWWKQNHAQNEGEKEEEEEERNETIRTGSNNSKNALHSKVEGRNKMIMSWEFFLYKINYFSSLSNNAPDNENETEKKITASTDHI